MSKTKGVIAPILSRLIAFFVDFFMILVPLLYITTYLILGSKEAFRQNQEAIFLIWLAFGIILSIFQTRTAQTPGSRLKGIYLIDSKTGKKATFIKCFFRYVIFWLFGMIGIFFCFFRKDRLNLHDILTGLVPVIKKQS